MRPVKTEAQLVAEGERARRLGVPPPPRPWIHRGWDEQGLYAHCDRCRERKYRIGADGPLLDFELLHSLCRA